MNDDSCRYLEQDVPVVRSGVSGDKVQHFCRPACCRALDAAGRRYISAALANGLLTVEALGKAFPTTRALHEPPERYLVDLPPAGTVASLIQRRWLRPGEAGDLFAVLLALRRCGLTATISRIC